MSLEFKLLVGIWLKITNVLPIDTNSDDTYDKGGLDQRFSMWRFQPPVDCKILQPLFLHPTVLIHLVHASGDRLSQYSIMHHKVMLCMYAFFAVEYSLIV